MCIRDSLQILLCVVPLDSQHLGSFRTPGHTLDEAKTGGRYLALERVQEMCIRDRNRPHRCGRSWASG